MRSFEVIGYIFLFSCCLLDYLQRLVALTHKIYPFYRSFRTLAVCVQWDYTPSRQITALFYPVFEYSFAVFLVLSYVYVKKCYLMHEIPKWLWRFEQVTFPIKLVLFAWVRMIFVFPAEENIVGHTLGFLGLQIAVALIALENVMLANARKEDYFHLGRKATRVLSWTYYFILLPATILKFSIDVGFLIKKPFVNIQDPVQVIFVHSLDKIWMIFAAILPFFFAIYQYKTEPHLQIKTESHLKIKIQ